MLLHFLTESSNVCSKCFVWMFSLGFLINTKHRASLSSSKIFHTHADLRSVKWRWEHEPCRRGSTRHRKRVYYISFDRIVAIWLPHQRVTYTVLRREVNRWFASDKLASQLQTWPTGRRGDKTAERSEDPATTETPPGPTDTERPKVNHASQGGIMPFSSAFFDWRQQVQRLPSPWLIEILRTQSVPHIWWGKQLPSVFSSQPNKPLFS